TSPTMPMSATMTAVMVLQERYGLLLRSPGPSPMHGDVLQERERRGAPDDGRADPRLAGDKGRRDGGDGGFDERGRRALGDVLPVEHGLLGQRRSSYAASSSE